MTIWIGLFALLGVTAWVGKEITDAIWLGPWEYRRRHKCGYRETFGNAQGINAPAPDGKVCPCCGGRTDWDIILCSYRPFIGWRNRKDGGS